MMLKIRRTWKCGYEGIYFNNHFCIPVNLTQIWHKKKTHTHTIAILHPVWDGTAPQGNKNESCY